MSSPPHVPTPPPSCWGAPGPPGRQGASHLSPISTLSLLLGGASESDNPTIYPTGGSPRHAGFLPAQNTWQMATGPTAGRSLGFGDSPRWLGRMWSGPHTRWLGVGPIQTGRSRCALPGPGSKGAWVQQRRAYLEGVGRRHQALGMAPETEESQSCPGAGTPDRPQPESDLEGGASQGRGLRSWGSRQAACPVSRAPGASGHIPPL